jgi:hypothetical protein
VWWNAGSRDATHLSKVWVWIDYITVNSNNTTSGNTWIRAAVGTISPTTGISYDGSNRNGFWLEGNSGSYSATVTVQLTNVPAKFNWCAYVSDYPPNVTAANGTYTFKGTPPFTLIASNGTTSQTITGNTLVASALTITPTTIRDKTECPGIFCPYQGSDLYMDATHLCQQRTSGAKNWEAYIKDTRDNRIYHITQFSDNTWWFADDLAIATKSVGTCNGTRYYLGHDKPSCPTGWRLPTNNEFERRWNLSSCGVINLADLYGAALTKGCCFTTTSSRCSAAGCDACSARCDWIFGDQNNSKFYLDNNCHWNCYGYGSSATVASNVAGRARCVR